MRSVTFLAMLLLVMETVTRPAWANGTTQTYQGNMLLLLFLGFCMLIVVSQMVPALILLMETVADFAKRVAARKQAAMVKVSQDETK
jgi:hypothetical protein